MLYLFLSQYLDDERLIALLSYYFHSVVPGFQFSSNKYRETYEAILNRFFADSQSRCVRKKDIDQINSLITPAYTRMKMTETHLKTVGFDIFEQLTAQGYKPRNKRNSRYEFEIDFVEKDELNLEKSEQKNKKIKGN